MVGVRRLLFAGTTVTLMAFAAACGIGDGDEDRGYPGGATMSTARGESVERQADDALWAPAPSEGSQAGAGTDTGGSNAAQGIDRKIVFRTTMTVTVDDVTASFDRVGSIARDAGGFVEKSSFTNEGEDDERRRASLTLRVPVAQYEGVVASLRSLPGGKVRGESAQATEVTEQYTDLQSRLRNLERVEGQYLDLLAKATTIQDILTVTDRLNGVRLEIEQIQGRIQVLDDLTEMASIEVMLASAGASVTEDGGPKSFRTAFVDAWDAALEAVQYVASAAAVATVAIIWLGIPLLAVAAGARWVSRRGRPAASP
ncbi:MAG: DUF4349 domain-containing protein [Dehalococcoidia bacterium]|nr:DUF4349 domain-containing protein [Dehalococcoidia bacterium]